MAKKKSPAPPADATGFGRRLARLRRERGLTQAQLGEQIGLSFRMVSYYERDRALPPGALLGGMARTLGVTLDELLGVTQVAPKRQPRTARLLKRLERIEELNPDEQRAVLKFLDGLLARRTLAEEQRRRKKVANAEPARRAS